MLINEPNIAAQRVSTFSELISQLRSILEGATRSMLASKDIHSIMGGRSEFGEAFTKEVDEQLQEWGVTSVKSIELMDIRDSRDSSVIRNIMEKKKSEIEKDSRMTVADNKKKAEEAEIAAQREVAVAKEQALQQIGIATATKTLEVGLANESTEQKIKEQQRITTEKMMEVQRVENVKKAEISKDVEVVKAQEDRLTEIERAEGEKQKSILIAEGKLQSEKMDAEAIKVRGEAEAEALKLKELAPVQAQITLAQEIGENSGYQSYLIEIRKIEASETIGKEQAQALTRAEVKVIANAGTPADGLKSVGELFSSSGGQKVGSMIEGLVNTEAGKELMNKFLK
jgi:flotillin